MDAKQAQTREPDRMVAFARSLTPARLAKVMLVAGLTMTAIGIAGLNTEAPISARLYAGAGVAWVVLTTTLLWRTRRAPGTEATTRMLVWTFATAVIAGPLSTGAARGIAQAEPNLLVGMLATIVSGPTLGIGVLLCNLLMQSAMTAPSRKEAARIRDGAPNQA